MMNDENQNKDLNILAVEKVGQLFKILGDEEGQQLAEDTLNDICDSRKRLDMLREVINQKKVQK